MSVTISSENRESGECDRNEFMFFQAEKREDAGRPPFGSAYHYGIVERFYCRFKDPLLWSYNTFCIIGDAGLAAIHRFSRKTPGVFPDAFISAGEIVRLAWIDLIERRPSFGSAE